MLQDIQKRDVRESVVDLCRVSVPDSINGLTHQKRLANIAPKAMITSVISLD